MPNTNPYKCISPRVSILQFIVLALLLVALAFAAFVMFTINWENFTTRIKMMTFFGSLTSIGLFGLAFVLPSMLGSPMEAVQSETQDNSNVTVSEESKIVASFRAIFNNRIIFCGLVLSAIFLNLMVFMLEQSAISLVIAAIGWLMLVIAFPIPALIYRRIANSINA